MKTSWGWWAVGRESAFHDGAGLTMRQQRLKGVAVVTDVSVVSLNPKVWHPMSETVTLRSTLVVPRTR